MSDLYAACVGRFYEDLARRLVEGASRVFLEAGGSVDVHEVPGAFELPLGAKYCAESGRGHCGNDDRIGRNGGERTPSTAFRALHVSDHNDFDVRARDDRNVRAGHR